MHNGMPSGGCNVELVSSGRRRRALIAVASALSSVGVWILFYSTWGIRAERRQLRAKVSGQGSEPRGKQKPNIVFLVLDQWRYDWDGMHHLNKLPLKMPFLKSVAERGTRFAHAYVPTPLCAPVRACLASGKEYDKAGVLDNHPNTWPLSQVTFYKLLRDKAGYHTMMVGKDDLYQHDVNFPYYPSAEHPDQQLLHDLGFSDARRSVSKTRVTKEVPPFDIFRTYLEQCQVDGRKAIDVYSDCFAGGHTLCHADTYTDAIYTDDFIQRQALEVLSNKPADKPYFLQINFAGPHPPNFIPSDLAATVKDRQWPDPIDNIYPERWACPEFTGKPQIGGRCSYAAELERLDGYLESIIQQVDLTKTVVCITGDHGEMLGDHNMGGKKVPYQPSISVPLLCMGAGVAARYVNTDPVTTLDLVGTFLELGGVTPDPSMTTQSLWSAMSIHAPTPRKVIHSGLDEWRLVIQKINGVPYKLVCCIRECPKLPKGTPLPPPHSKWHVLLYDTVTDPNDEMSLHETHPNIVEQLKTKLPQGWCQDWSSLQ
jgi:arylsulfatase A-like enzyme